MKLSYGLTESMQQAALIPRKGREMGLSYGKYENRFPTKAPPKKRLKPGVKICKKCGREFELPILKDGDLSQRRVNCDECVAAEKRRYGK
jgi:hypothetical protein